MNLLDNCCVKDETDDDEEVYVLGVDLAVLRACVDDVLALVLSEETDGLSVDVAALVCCLTVVVFVRMIEDTSDVMSENKVTFRL